MMTDTIPESGDTGRRFCDLVMKGGITSGIVFPTAVARLSTQYRFRHIGGTSAGAIAAAGAAAAEFRRATDRVQPGYGFAELARLPEYLGGRPERGHSRLFRLFEPEPAARRHFAILAAMLNRTSVAARVLHGSRALAWAFPLAAVLGAIPGLILVAAAHGGSPLGIVAAAIAALFAVAGGIAGAVVAATASLARLLPACEFGLVRGHSTSGDRSRLTDWLHGYLQDLAGKRSGEPLTFGDLDGVLLDPATGVRGIDLQMMTTALSLGRPYSLPFDNEQFYFKPDELALYFPADVIEWMVAHPGDRSNANRARDDAMRSFGYQPLPMRATLPVIVAVRLSLSFPVLLSAVPLYRYAWERFDRGTGAGAARREGTYAAENAAIPPGDDTSDVDAAPSAAATTAREPRFIEANVRRVLFSDGGICSNFPLQMFDAVLPGWRRSASICATT